MLKKRISLLLSVIFTLTMFVSFLPPKTVRAEGEVAINRANFPDENFFTYVYQNCQIGERNYTLTEEELLAVTEINCSGLDISNFTGLEHFTNLQTLDISSQFGSIEEISTLPAVTLDLSGNPNLTTLNCKYNNIGSLDLSANTALVSVYCSNCNLDSLNISNLDNLTALQCNNNNLEELSVSANANLTTLWCQVNNLTSIDVSHNTALKDLRCNNNAGLTSLNVSANPGLTSLMCYDCSLSELNLSNNGGLTALQCHNNNLTTLDVSNAANLRQLYVYGNSITSLDISHNPYLVQAANTTASNVNDHKEYKKQVTISGDMTYLELFVDSSVTLTKTNSQLGTIRLQCTVTGLPLNSGLVNDVQFSLYSTADSTTPVWQSRLGDIPCTLSGSAFYTVDIPVAAGSYYMVQENYNLDSYTTTPHFKVGLANNGDGDTTDTFTVSARNRTNCIFTNTYSPYTGTIKISGSYTADPDIPDSNCQYTLTLTGPQNPNGEIIGGIRDSSRNLRGYLCGDYTLVCNDLGDGCYADFFINDQPYVTPYEFHLNSTTISNIAVRAEFHEGSVTPPPVTDGIIDLTVNVTGLRSAYDFAANANFAVVGAESPFGDFNVIAGTDVDQYGNGTYTATITGVPAGRYSITQTTPNMPDDHEVYFGWTIGSAGGMSPTTGNFTVTAGETIEVSYDTSFYKDVPTYTVTFERNGHGSRIPSAQQIEEGECVIEPTTTPYDSSNKYDFGGWYTESSCENEYDFDTPVTQDLHLWALWIPRAVTVTFDANGQANVTGLPTPQTVNKGETVTEPATTPTASGVVFGGWYTTAECTTAYNFENPVNESMTLYAKWEAATYTVTFDANGHGTAPEAQTIAYGGHAAVPSPAPSETGATFGGWYRNEECSGTAFNFETEEITEDITLYAKWTVNTYTVFFNANGVPAADITGMPSSQTVDYNGHATEPAEPSAVGYTFDGWYTRSSCAEEYRFNFATDTIRGTTNLYAKWTPITYQVTFEAPGRVAAGLPDTLTVQHGQYVTRPENDPTVEGANFAGWFSNEACTTPFEFATHAITDDTTIYAKFTDLYVVTFIMNGHGTPIESYELEAGAVINDPGDPSAEGWTFDGWYANEGLTGNAYTFGSGITQNVTLYAKWTPITYQVTFEAPGREAEGLPTPQTVQHGQYVTMPENDPTVEGANFAGWFSDEDCTDPFDFDNDAITDDTTIYAKFTDLYVVTFVMNGHGTQIPGYELEAGTTVTRPANPTEEGWTFVAWYANEDLSGTPYVFGSGISDNVTLYAKWSPVTYTVSFNANGHGTAPAVQHVDRDQYATNPGSLSVDGWRFEGWFRYEDLSDGSSFNFAGTQIQEDITLYAKWTRITVSFEFNANTTLEVTCMPANQMVNWGEAPVAPTTTPSAEGAIFTGWYTNETGNTRFDFTQTITGRTVAYAHWSNVYTVSYDMRGHGTQVPSESVIEGHYATRPADPSEQGWIFGGWYTSTTFTDENAFDFETDLIDGNIKLYAKWTAAQYTVIFNPNGHGTAPDAQTVEYNGHAAEPDALTETGYTFGGWYRNHECTDGNEFNFAEDQIIGDIELFAKWTAEVYTVTFDANGRTATNMPRTQEISYGSYAAEPPVNPTSSGANFAGWFADPECETPFNFTSVQIFEDTRVYAKWNEEFTVRFIMNGHGEQIPSQTISGTDPITRPEDPTATGYIFRGWYENDGFMGDAYTFTSVVNRNVTLYAKWEAENYTVTFNANTTENVTGMPAAQHIDYNQTASAPTPTPAVTGYTFDGWYTEAACENRYDFSTPVTSSFDLYAKWTPIIYTITFYGNLTGGTVTDLSGQINVAYNGYADAPADPTATGYTFGGWYLTPACDGSQFNFASTRITQNYELYAKWTPVTYSVTFSANGRTADGMPAEQTVNHNGNAVRPTSNPTSEGANFVDWYADPGCTTLFNWTAPITTDTTVYAKWTSLYTVTFDIGNIGTPIEAQTIANGGTVSQPADPSATGYTFGGWYVSADFSGDVYDFTTPVTDNVTLHAKWTRNTYTVTFVSSRGTVPPAQVVAYGNTATEPDESLVEGYDLTGWYTRDDFEGEAYDFATPVTSNVTLYAQWTAKTFRVTFDANGRGNAANMPGQQTVSYGNNAVRPSDPSAAGFTFGGWYRDEACETPFNFSDDTITRSITLYAKWTQITYTVSFDPNGRDSATGLPDPLTVAHGAVASEPSERPSVSGANFIGWFMEPECENPFDWSTPITGNLPLYAGWTDLYAVTFIMNGHGTPVAAQSVARGEFAEQPDEPTAYGFTFGGWYDNVGLSGSRFNFTNPVNGNVTLYAKWNPNTYMVSFDVDGHGTAPADQYVLYLDTAARPAEDPSAEGFDFGGWYTAAGEPFDFSTPIEDDTVLYAKWTVSTYTVSYSLNGNTNALGLPLSETVEHGSYATIPDDEPYADGYTFGGWYTDAECTGDAYVFTTPVTRSFMLYAKWIPNTYEVTFVSGRTATGMPDPLTVEHGSTVAEPTSTPTSEGANFAGWYADPGCTTVYNWNTPVTGPTTIYAKWTDLYTVNFVMNGHGTQVESQIVAPGGVATVPAAPSATGWTFGGWYESDTFDGDAYTFGTPVNGNVTLYAKWTIKTYTVTFDENGYGMAPDAQTVEYNGHAVEPAALTETGWTFGGWYTNDQCDDESRFIFEDEQITRSITLYAKWTINTYAVTFITDYGTSPSTQYVRYNGYATAPASNPWADGFDFGGWYDNVDFNGDAFDFANEKITDNVTLYALWIPVTYQITFVTDHGTAPAEQTVNYYNYATRPADPSEEGYEFIDWYDNSGFQGDPFDFAGTPISRNVTLYALWETETFTVTFVENGQANVTGMPTPQTVDYNGTVTAPETNPTAEGANFAGWYAEPTCENLYVWTTPVTGPVTIYAKWTDLYTVTFVMNGTAAPIEAQTVADGDRATEPADPVMTGYTFDGWYEDRDFGGDEYDFTSQISGNVTLYAKWNVNTYTVTFDANGGENEPAAVSVDYNGYAEAPEAPSMTGYTFGGWYVDPDDENAFDFTGTPITEDITLIAKWDINYYTVTFDNSGRGSSTASQRVPYGGHATEPSVTPVAEGYVFAGWYADLNDDAPYDFASEEVTEPVTLYALWTVNTYVVSFNANGHGDAPARQNIGYNGNAYRPSPDPTAEGYTFRGWYLDASCEGDPYDFATPITGNITLHAKWELNRFTVTFDANGHGTAPADQSIGYNGYVTDPAGLSADGYTFLGWFTESTGGEEFDFAGTQITVDTTIYAHWSINTYTVTFNANGHGDDPARQNIEHGGNAFAPTVTNIEEGYTLRGWYRNEAGEGDAFDFENTPITGPITLYAVWDIGSYTVSFDLNGHGSEAIADQTVEYGGLVDMPSDPSEDGWTFEGWFMDRAGTEEFHFDTDTVTSSFPLYAKWTETTYTVTYVANGHGEVPDPITVRHGLTAGDLPVLDDVDGWRFDGWYQEDTCRNRYEPDTQIFADTRIYAHWVQQVTVSFNANRTGTVTNMPTPITVDIRTAAAEPAITPSAEGVTFEAWYTDEDCTIEYDWGAVQGDIELFAKWNDNYYTVEFEGLTTTARVRHGGTVSSLPDPAANDGFRFDGWYTDDTFETEFTTATPVMSDMTVVPKWVAQVTVTFNDNGHSDAENIPDDMTFDAGTVLDMPEPTPSAEGVTFAGWYRDAEGNEAYAFGTEVNANVDLFAKWSTVNCTVSFDLNGHGTDIDDIVVAYDGTVASIPVPADVDGFRFDGWYVDDTTRFTSDYHVKGDITVVARWVAQVTITFDSNGHPEALNLPEPVTVDVDTGFAMPTPTPSATGVTFTGWYINADGSGPFDFSAGSDSSITIYANWATDTRTVTFNMNGHGTDIDPVVVEYNSTTALPVPAEVDGFRFDGWYTDDSYDTLVDSSYHITENIEVVAKWVEQVTVSFEGNLGTDVANLPDDITIDIGTVCDEPAVTPAAEGYTFIGWFADPGCNDEFDFSAAIDADTPVYAGWDVNMYTISFDTNGIGTAPASIPVAYGSTYTEVLPTPAAVDGYRFDGWFYDDEFQNPFDPSRVITGDVELIAKWVAQYTVTYYANTDVDVADMPAGGNFDEGTQIYTPATTPSADGHNFTGWYTDDECGSQYVEGSAIHADLDLYAGWDVQMHQVTFDVGTVGTAPAPRNVAHGSTMTVTPVPAEVDGYRFDGWYQDAGLSTPFTNEITVTEPITVYAKWVQTVTVSFASTRTAQNMPDDIVVDLGDTIDLPAEIPTTDGYTFDRWCTNADLVQGYTFGTPVTQGMTLYADWTINTYDVTFYANNENTVNGMPANTTAQYNSTLVRPAADPACEGFTFDGWYTNEACTTAYSFGTPVTGNVDLYAKWNPLICTVTFVTNETVTAPTPTTVPFGGTISLPSVTSDAYAFEGWYTDDSYGTVFTNDTAVTGNISVYAKLTLNTFDVTFDANGHGTAPATQTVGYNGHVEQPADLEAEGWIFGGWYENADCTGDAFDFEGIAVTEGFTLYAKWTEVEPDMCTVTFVTSNGVAAPTPVSVVSGGRITPPTVNDPAYDFDGWYLDEEFTQRFTVLTNVTEDITLYAKLTDKTFTVRFVANGHGTAPDTVVVNYNGTVAQPAALEAEGFTFGGWYMNVACTGDAYNFSTPVTSNISLYAKWIPITHTVTFDANGHGTAPAAQTVNHNAHAARPSSPTATGYAFGGWYENADCTGSSFNFNTARVTSDVTLYARWITINTPAPTGEPSGAPTGEPSGAPTGEPSGAPTGEPSGAPTGEPSGVPTVTAQPTGEPSGVPTVTTQPTGEPTVTGEPTGEPSGEPSVTEKPDEPTDTPSATPTASPATSEDGVSGFVERLYVYALGRNSDPVGKADWIAAITERGSTGADAARGFLYSDEFLNKNVSNEEFVKTLYRVFFDREPDTDGFNAWVAALNGGASKQDVIEGFINSTEWANLCLRYGIASGGTGVPNVDVEPNQGIIDFCTRLYTTCLNRNADPEGLMAWARQLANQRETGTGAARGFFFSDEFINQNVSDGDYITRLYRTFMGREPEQAGYDAWMAQLAQGVSREEVFNGFAQSQEFGVICAQYGIIR